MHERRPALAGLLRDGEEKPQANWRKVLLMPEIAPAPAQPGTTMTGLSRRTSRVRAPSRS
jgi:hypothetical protein